MEVKNSLPTGTILKGLSYTYRIEKTLGQGSFGITYLASVKMAGALGAIDTSVKVAIKEFFMRDINGRADSTVTSGSKGGIYEDYKRKFTREAINLSKLQHPNIIKVIESFEANNTVYYVMEYMSGGSLDDYIAKHSGLKEDEAIKIVKQIASALSFMHEKNMLHLDLKPSNIMRKESGDVVLIDFGLSKQYDVNGEPESSTKVGAGTPGYAPLEQANYREGKGFPVTMDVYALGATMFKMLTGVRPPEASDILNDGFPLYELQERGISDRTSASVAKAMAATKKNRYDSVKYFIDSLEEEDTVIDVDVVTERSKSKEYKTQNNIEIDDSLPIPDGGISISLSNPASGSLSYQFYLNERICNTVFVYRDGRKILDEDFSGGISPEVIEALKQNGFFSKVHWERESSTVPLDGIVVSCSFFYKNGNKFVREVKHANPAFYNRLLDAVNNVVKVEELSQWINEALNREHKYDHDDIEQYGISVFSFTSNYEMPIYYRGHTYSGKEIGAYGLKSFSEIDNAFKSVTKNLQKKSSRHIDFDTYLRDNKEILAQSFNIITYCGESDLLKIQYQLRQNPSLFGNYRIIQEMQLLPLCFVNSHDSIIGYEYQQHLYCEADCGDGVMEILQAGYVERKDDFFTVETVKKMSNYESFAYLILSSIVQYHILHNDWEDDALLISVIPFEIKAEVWTNGQYRNEFIILDRNTSIPCKEVSQSIDYDNCTIVISFLGKRFKVDVRKLLGYNFKSIEITTDINQDTRIYYIIRDTEKEKEISISQDELFDNEIKTYNEETTI